MVEEYKLGSWHVPVVRWCVVFVVSLSSLSLSFIGLLALARFLQITTAKASKCNRP